MAALVPIMMKKGMTSCRRFLQGLLLLDAALNTRPDLILQGEEVSFVSSISRMTPPEPVTPGSVGSGSVSHASSKTSSGSLSKRTYRCGLLSALWTVLALGLGR